MNNQTIAAGVDYVTATLLLSADGMPAYSLWAGEIDLSFLQGNETGQLIEYSQLTRCTLDALEGINFRLLNQTVQVEEEERGNTIRRLFFEIQNTTNAPRSFGEARIILGGRASTVGYARPRPPMAPIALTPSAPFIVKDRDGAPLDASQIAFTRLAIVASATRADVADSVSWADVTGKPDGLGSTRIYDDAFSPDPNGANLIFTTSQPFRPSSTAVFLNGVRQKRDPNFQYVEDGSSIVFTSAPYADDCLVIDFDVA